MYKVIGNGMLAQALLNYFKTNQDLVFFASGVSNSDCTDTKQFERERTLLCKELDKNLLTNKFIYFGTCSIYDPDSQEKPYLTHKINMEKLVLSHPCGCVFRLPQLAGSNGPQNNLL